MGLLWEAAKKYFFSTTKRGGGKGQATKKNELVLKLEKNPKKMLRP